MRIDAARELKATLWQGASSASPPAAPPAQPPAAQASAQAYRPVLPCFVGVSLLGPARYGVAVRYRDAAGAAIAERAAAMAGDEADVREVGVVRALNTASRPSVAGADIWSPRRLRRRTRPLRPGLSVAHRAVSAGTLGAFVTVAGHPGVFVLSNNHVVADSDRGHVGDPVLQPGHTDGGTEQDAIGRLARAVAMSPTGPNDADAAVAALDAASAAVLDSRYPGGTVQGWAPLDDEVTVDKVGRTTGVTRGRVTAIELDDVTVEYPLGPITFDGQIEVCGDDGPFSRGGDSGALVYRPDSAEAVGMVFAGSDRGGPGGTGLTYCNPIGVVLGALDATLVT